MGVNQPGIEKVACYMINPSFFCVEYSETPVLHHHVDLTEKL